MPNFRNLIDADLERIRAEATTELNRRRAEREKIAYAKRVANARRSDEELKALLACKKRQELMDRAEKLADEERDREIEQTLGEAARRQQVQALEEQLESARQWRATCAKANEHRAQAQAQSDHEDPFHNRSDRNEPRKHAFARVEYLDRDIEPLKPAALEAAYRAAAKKHVEDLYEPRRVSLSHWGMFEVPTRQVDARVGRYTSGAWVN